MQGNRMKGVADQEIILSGDLAEMREALLYEIEASRRNASSAAVPLVNGRRISHVGGIYQYVFGIDSPLNLPVDTPGDLQIPGRRPLEVTVVSIDGMAIVLGVPADLGSHVPSAWLQSNLTYLLRKLIDRIEAMNNKSNPVGARILGQSPVSGQSIPVEVAELNSDQVKAVSSSLGQDATFIWGPPGTGKTRTIGTIGEQLYRGAPLWYISDGCTKNWYSWTTKFCGLDRSTR